jgi:LPS O-antigen subunit length determinant protein (WzzB/FepE family)
MLEEDQVINNNADLSEPSDSKSMQSPDILDAILGLWRARNLLVSMCALGSLIALVYVTQAPVLYTAQLTLTPSESSPSASASRLGNLASLAGISTGSHAGAPFDLFLLALQSREVATVLAQDEIMLKTLFPERWDHTRGKWLTSADSVTTFSYRRLLGLPVASMGRPSASEVNDLLNKQVKIGQNVERGTATILFDNKDPFFAAQFITRITAAADGFVKSRTLARSKEYISYIEKRLQTTIVAEHREALATELGIRQRSMMLASSSLYFAVDPLGEPFTSTSPSSPRPFLLISIGIIGGFAVGLLILLILNVRKRARAHDV